MTNTRRSFLGGLSGVAAAGLAWSPLAAQTTDKLKPLLADAAGSEQYWNLVVEQFPLLAGKIPMNAANLCPSPRVVSERVAELLRDEDSDVSNPNRSKFNTLADESRARVAEYLGVSADEIALVRNTSEANNTINNGVPLTTGDEVVIWDQNHQCNNMAWDVRAARHGFTVKRVTVPATVTTQEEILKLFEAALTAQTKVLSITYISNTTGMRLPAKELCSMARQRGIYAHLDGAQTFGYLKLNLKDIGCDSFSASAHKWFMGPKQVGVLYVRQERIADVWPSIVSVGWSKDALTTKIASKKFETLGQRDDGAISAVATAVDFHRSIGFENVEARTTALATTLKAGLARLNKVKMVTPMDPQLSGGVVISQMPDLDRPAMSKLVKDLYDKYGIAAAATGGLRLSPHVYNSKADVDLAIRAVGELLG
jgi:selenocysteine lyase/cysteine desulfurase